MEVEHLQWLDVALPQIEMWLDAVAVAANPRSVSLLQEVASYVLAQACGD